jgi:hypothetical protein
LNRLAGAFIALALLVLGWHIAFRPVGDESLRAHLHDRAFGTVENVVVLDPDYTRLTVSWSDRTGRRHMSQFDTDTYPWADGEAFDIVYDAHDARRPARPADANNTNNGFLRVDAYVDGGLVAGAGVVALLALAYGEQRRRMLSRLRPHDPVLTWRQLGLPSPSSRAWDEGETVQRWWRFGRRWRPFALVGAAVLVVAVAVGLEIQQSDARLLRTGVRVAGLVVDGGWDGSRFGQAYVDVRFTDRDERTHEETLYGPSPADLPTGSKVLIIYGAEHPNDFRTDAYANHDDAVHFLGLLAPPLLAGALLFRGLVIFVIYRYGRRMLRHEDWQQVEMEAAHPGMGRGGYGYEKLRLVTAPGAVIVVRVQRAAFAFAAGYDDAARAAPEELKPLRICPSRGNRMLVDADLLKRPFFAKLPRSLRQARRWATRADEPV